MSYNIYRVNSKAFEGFIYLKYTNGKLSAIDIPNPMKREVFRALLQYIEQEETEIKPNSQIIGTSIICQKMNARTAKDKLIMFAMSFRHYRGFNYQASEIERANIKNVPVTKELLDCFFTDPLGKFTITNYIYRINITRDQLVNGKRTAGSYRFPSHYDRDVEAKLSGQELQAYYKHLKANGWVRIRHAVTQQMIWKEVKR